MTFAERLHDLRLQNGMSMNDIAEYIGVQRATVYKYEHGFITNIPPDKVHKLANLFGVTRPYMMGWTDDPNENPSRNLDTVAERLSVQTGDIVAEGDSVYWQAAGDSVLDCTTAATQAARALIKFKIARTPIYPQQILQSSKYATMISFSQKPELEDLAVYSNIQSYRQKNDLMMASVYTDMEGQHHYLFAVNRNAPMGHLKLTLAVELGHIYLGHLSNLRNETRKEQEAQCFAIHLEFPRPLIRLLMDRGFIFTKETFSRIFGDCEWCLDSILNANAVSISPELNRLVKEQFVPYVDMLEEMGILSMPIHHGDKPIDLSRYMEGYED